MVNERVTDARAAERRLVLSYAPAGCRAGLAALLALDDTLGQVLRTTREPLVGQMRLTWWHEALNALDGGVPPAQPVLQALAADVMPAGVTGERLAEMIDGWEAMLDPLDAAALGWVAAMRGEGLFDAMAAVIGAHDPRVEAAGRGWVLADLSRSLSDSALAGVAREQAGRVLDKALGGRWPRRLRVIGALALTARADVERPGEAPATPRRVARLLVHRLTGR